MNQAGITSRQRRRTEDIAVKFFREHTSRRLEAQLPFIKQIRSVKQPGREAQKIIAEEKRRKLPKPTTTERTGYPVWDRIWPGVGTPEEGLLEFSFKSCPSDCRFSLHADYALRKSNRVHHQDRSEYHSDAGVAARWIDREPEAQAPKIEAEGDIVYLGKYRWRRRTLYGQAA